MFLLLPIPTTNTITEKEDGVTISLVPITFASVLSIDEDLETGNAIIKYQSGAIIKTKISFIKILTSLSQQNAVNFVGTLECQGVSTPFKNYCNSL